MLKLKKNILLIGFSLAIPLIGGIASACSTAGTGGQRNQGTNESLPGEQNKPGGNNNQTQPGEADNKQAELEKDKQAVLAFYKKINHTKVQTKNTTKKAKDVGDQFREKVKSSPIAEQIKFINEEIKETSQHLPSDLTAPDTFQLKISANLNASLGLITFKFSLLKNEKIYDTDGSPKDLDDFGKQGLLYKFGKDVDVEGYTKESKTLNTTPSIKAKK
ncbi:hypothetical protein [Mycoplasma amphoriforme]|uniref:Uncharacterized protein n=1 Tax=Mycoplasma amphoriforme A39 TaxID=572419 RepID=A0A292IIW8_9MOLU|nr:unnamed protein product [Mycoplasma amphoriforme A39]